MLHCKLLKEFKEKMWITDKILEVRQAQSIVQEKARKKEKAAREFESIKKEKKKTQTATTTAETRRTSTRT